MNRISLYFAAVALTIPFSTASQAAPKEQDWNKVADKAIEYLKSTQLANGSWGQEPRSRGVAPASWSRACCKRASVGALTMPRPPRD